MYHYREPLLAQFQVFASKSQVTRILIAVAGILFVLAILIEWLHRRGARKSSIASSIRDFERLVQRKGLTREETKLMYRLAKRSRIATPLPLATSALRFDEAVRAELDRLRQTADEGDAVARVCSAIREKLGLTEIPPGHGLPSTRFLPGGQRLVIGKADVPAEPGYPAEVVSVADTGITVSWPARGGEKAKLSTGDRLRIAMWRSNDARYSFDTTVKSIIQEPEPRLELRHAAALVRVQSRKCYRIQVNMPLVLHYVPGERAEPATSVDTPVHAVSRTHRISARLTTLSGGGISMVCDQSIPVDAVLRSHIPIEGSGTPVPVACRVVSAATSRTRGRYVLRAEFIAVDEEDRDRIFRYVSLKQQERIAETA